MSRLGDLLSGSGRSRSGPIDATSGLVVDGLDAGYGRVPVLRDVSLKVDRGESVALLGANGAGKTTFLRTISGLVEPSAGAVSFGGLEIGGAPPPRVLRLGIAHVPQGRLVFATQTVEENLLLGSRLREDRDRVRADLEYILDVFPALAEKLKQSAGDLSGGQQQALAIARALMSGPELLLLDEPSVGLAPRLVDDLGQLLERIRNDRRMSMLLVEQDTVLALQLTERAYVMQRGEITLERESASLTDDPSVVFAYLGGEQQVGEGSGPGRARESEPPAPSGRSGHRRQASESESGG